MQRRFERRAKQPPSLRRSCIAYFVKDTLLYEAQLPLNTLSEPLSVNSRISAGMAEKGMPPNGLGDVMTPPPGPPPGGEDGMRIFEDNIMWYRLSLQDTITLNSNTRFQQQKQ
jgi:hypothetical protein